jgi:predicted small lipoprotein YifL
MAATLLTSFGLWGALWLPGAKKSAPRDAVPERRAKNR